MRKLISTRMAVFFFFFIFLATSSHGALKPDESPQGFIVALVDTATTSGVSKAHRKKLLNTATLFAKVYGDISNDAGALSKLVEAKRSALASSPDVNDTKKTGLELYNEMIEEQRHATVLRSKIEEFVMSFLFRAINAGSDKDKDTEIRTAFELSAVYSEVWKDNGTFRFRIKHLVETLPSKEIKSDDDIVEAFGQAMRHDNVVARRYLVLLIKDRIEPFVNNLIDLSMGPASAMGKKDLLTIAMNMAKTYGNMIGDHSFHRKIHRKTFTSRLHKPVAGQSSNGIYIIETPKAGASMLNLFIPDNIVIKTGDTVRWVNYDDTTHVIGTFDFLSDGHFFAPSITKGGSFEYTFDTAGDYYYICYIHSSMIGKISVRDNVK